MSSIGPKGKKANGRKGRKKKGRGNKGPSVHEEKESQTYTKEDLLGSVKQFRDVPPEERHALMVKKLRLCCVIFDFSPNPLPDSDGVNNVSPKENLAREVKRQQLLELVENVTATRNWFNEEILMETLKMVSKNLFRSLPPSPYSDWDPEEDDPALDPQWPHLQLCYEYLLRFAVSNQADIKLLKKHIDRKFLINLIDLFASEDPRERDYLKTILHRIYGKFMAFRSFIRQQINNVFYNVIYESGKHNGISELLEILGSIINGFALPLKQEHKSFLSNVLIPLHKVRTLQQFSQQLAYCVTQFIEKDSQLTSKVISGLLKYWPIQSATKEQLFLNEMEEILETATKSELEKILVPLFTQIARCVASQHFQVAERALFLWNNEAIASFTNEHRKQILPILYPALVKNTKDHWNTTVHSLAFNIIRLFMDMDIELWNEVSREYDDNVEPLKEKKEKRERKWSKLRKMAQAKEEKAVGGAKDNSLFKGGGRFEAKSSSIAAASASSSNGSFATLVAPTAINAKDAASTPSQPSGDPKAG